MLRKFAILTGTLVTLAGLSFAADDESPTTKIMEQIQNKTNALRKATRTKADFAKSTAAIGKDTEAVVKLAKEAREIKEPAEKEKKPLAAYQKFMDEMIKSAEDLGTLAAKKGATQVQAKEAFTNFTKTCAACHEVFKKDE